MSAHLSTRRPPRPQGPRTPAVGRAVRYFAPGSAPGTAKELRATILELVDAEVGLMRLQVVDPYNSFMTLEAHFSEKPKPGRWSWPALRR